MPANHVMPGHVYHHPRGGMPPHAGPPTPHDKLVKNAKKLVSQTFFGTMLKQMHNSPFKSKIFSGGRGGEAFGSMLDQQLADRMSSGAGGGLVDAMVRRMEAPRKGQGEKSANSSHPPMSPATMPKVTPSASLKVNGYRDLPALKRSTNVAAGIRA